MIAGHWEQLAQDGQSERLAVELGRWKTALIGSLQNLLDHAAPDDMEGGEELLLDLGELDPAAVAQHWSASRPRLEELGTNVAQMRKKFLLDRGPTSNLALNSMLFHLEAGAEVREEAVGAALLADLKQFRLWAAENRTEGKALSNLLELLEKIALGPLRGEKASASVCRQQLSWAWELLERESAERASQAALPVVTRSPRWNSWMLLLLGAEKGEGDPALLLQALAALDRDVEEMQPVFADFPRALATLEDYFETSAQLRETLQQGRKVKGWSAILSPLLKELDDYWILEASSAAPTLSTVRLLCQDFETGVSLYPQFQAGLKGLRASLQEGARLAPGEAALQEALGRLEAGLEILAEVASPGQVAQMEMGCSLTEEGLRLLEAVSKESVHGW